MGTSPSVTGRPVDRLPIKAMFDRDPEKLMFFLNQVWANLDCYAPAYPLEIVMANAMNSVNSSLEEEAKLHNDAPELGNINAFLGELRARFEDESQALQAGEEIWDLK